MPLRDLSLRGPTHDCCRCTHEHGFHNSLRPRRGDAGHGAGRLPLAIGPILAVFDGVFVCHDFIEAFLGRFSDPYFRPNMSSLYFTPQPKPA